MVMVSRIAGMVSWTQSKKQHWTIRFSSGNDSFLVGVAWIPNGHRAQYALPWPAVFPTRREARDMARTMTHKYIYLRPSHIWKFSPVRVTITVDGGEG